MKSTALFSFPRTIALDGKDMSPGPEHMFARVQWLLWIAFASTLLVGCGTIRIPVKYEHPASHQPEFGAGKPVHLQVMDLRVVTNSIGEALEIQKRRIEPLQPVSRTVDEAFRAALSRANYVLSDTADLGYRVKILQFEVKWEAKFSSTIKSSVNFEIAVLKDGQTVGSKVIGETRVTPQRLSDNWPSVASALLSSAMSEAVYKAAKDTTLNLLLRRPDALAATADPATTLSPPRREAAVQPEKDAGVVESPPLALTGADAELEERQWNQALLKNTAQAYFEYYKTYTNSGRMKVLTGTLTAQMGMELNFGGRSDGPNVKKVILSMDQHPGFRQEISVEEAARWKIINYEPLGNGAAKIGTKDPMPNATVILVKQRSATAAAKTEFKVVTVEAGGAK